MTALYNMIGVSVLVALCVGCFSTGALAQGAPAATPGLGGSLRGILQIKGKVLCAKCNIDEVRTARPDLSNLFAMTHRLGQLVIQIEEVNERSLWRHLMLAHVLHARGADRFFSQLAAEENLFQKVTISGLLRDTRILDISDVTVLKQDTSEDEEK